MPKEPLMLVFQLLAALGALALLALFMAPFFFLKTVDPVIPSGGPSAALETKLGELGAACGGSALLPCKFGLKCSASPTVKDGEGVCIK